MNGDNVPRFSISQVVFFYGLPRSLHRHSPDLYTIMPMPINRHSRTLYTILPALSTPSFLHSLHRHSRVGGNPCDIIKTCAHYNET